MLSSEERTWFYFGCTHGSGHRLVERNGNNLYHREFTKLDGKLCPPEDKGLYTAVMTRIPHLGYTSLAWWDRSVDRRPGSNSIIFAPSLTTDLTAIRTAMTKWFPWVEKRLPRPLIIADFILTHDPKC